MMVLSRYPQLFIHFRTINLAVVAPWTRGKVLTVTKCLVKTPVAAANILSD